MDKHLLILLALGAAAIIFLLLLQEYYNNIFLSDLYQVEREHCLDEADLLFGEERDPARIRCFRIYPHFN